MPGGGKASKISRSEGYERGMPPTHRTLLPHMNVYRARAILTYGIDVEQGDVGPCVRIQRQTAILALGGEKRLDG